MEELLIGAILPVFAIMVFLGTGAVVGHSSPGVGGLVGTNALVEGKIVVCGRGKWLVRVMSRKEIEIWLLRCGVGWNPGPCYPCGGCKREVGTRGYSVRCSRCEIWWHSKCSGLQVSDIKSMKGNHGWQCVDCNVVEVSSSQQSSNRAEVEVVRPENSETSNAEETYEFQPNCGKCSSKLRKGQGIACTRCKRRTPT